MIWYRSGTVSLNNGSNVVAGSVTNWSTNGIKPGDIFTTDNEILYEIQTVNDDGHLTLDRNYEGTTASDAAYAIIQNLSPYPATVLASMNSALAALTAATGGFGTLSSQNKSAVQITGGAIDDTVIGGSMPAAGAFTTLSVAQNLTLTGSAAAGTQLVIQNTDVGGLKYGIGTGGSAGGDFPTGKLTFREETDNVDLMFLSHSAGLEIAANTAITGNATISGTAAIIGALTAASVNGLTVSTTTGTLSIADAKTLTLENSLHFAGTDGSSLNIGGGGSLNGMAFQDPASVAITGGSLSGVSLGFAEIGSSRIDSKLNGGAALTTGVGLELSYDGTANSNAGGAYLQSYDRANSAYKDLKIDGRTLELNSGSHGPVAISTTPSAWPAADTINAGGYLDIGGAGTLYGQNNSITYFGNNFYNDGTNWRAKVTGPAGIMAAATDGSFIFYSAPSVAAGGTQTYSLLGSFNANGTMNITVGGTSGNQVVVYNQVRGAAPFCTTGGGFGTQVAFWTSVFTAPSNGILICKANGFNADMDGNSAFSSACFLSVSALSLISTGSGTGWGVCYANGYIPMVAGQQVQVYAECDYNAATDIFLELFCWFQPLGNG